MSGPKWWFFNDGDFRTFFGPTLLTTPACWLRALGWLEVSKKKHFHAKRIKRKEIPLRRITIRVEWRIHDCTTWMTIFAIWSYRFSFFFFRSCSSFLFHLWLHFDHRSNLPHLASFCKRFVAFCIFSLLEVWTFHLPGLTQCVGLVHAPCLRRVKINNENEQKLVKSIIE